MSEKINYVPNGVCARAMQFEVENDIIQNIQIDGGCPGNLLGISKMLVGKNVKEIIDTFSGVKCGAKATSCPDQIAIALSKHFQVN